MSTEIFQFFGWVIESNGRIYFCLSVESFLFKCSKEIEPCIEFKGGETWAILVDRGNVAYQKVLKLVGYVENKFAAVKLILKHQKHWLTFS